ncbi:MAG: serine hydrolase [Verrucomicrobiia bacterium]
MKNAVHGMCSALCLAFIIVGLTGRPALATSYTNTIAQMTAYITSQMATNNVQGLSITLVDGQKVVWATGFGKADRERRVSANANTVYHIGSCSKSFAATALMQLWDQGQLDLEAPLTTYMPEYSMLPRFTNTAPVTIRSLLNHHSGIPGDIFNGLYATQNRNDAADWFIRYLQGDYPFAPVNERNYYCNTGFVLLSDVIGRITGEPFSTATRNMIFRPLGMNASSFLPDRAAISNRLAAAYNANGERELQEIVNAQGSGAMYSSVNDLTKYIRMILADGRFRGRTLMSSNAIEEMITPQLANLPLNVTDAPAGLGWDNVSDNRLRYAGKVFWKDGAVEHHCAFLGISRDLQLGVAVIQNTPGNLCDSIGIESLRWAILDKQGVHWPTNTFVPTFSSVTNWSQGQLDALAGIYVPDAGYNKVVAEPGTLTLIVHADFSTPKILSNLVPRVNGWFSRPDSQDPQLAFTNLSGHAMLVLHQSDDAFESVSPLGEYYLPEPPSAAWCSRTNRVYRMVDMYPFDYFWQPGQYAPKTLRFGTTEDDVLLANWFLGSYTIEPQNDNLSFQRGVQYRKGGAIKVATTNGFELLQYSGYRFMDEAAIPTLSVPAVTNGAIPFANGTQWYWFNGGAGTNYQFSVTAPTTSPLQTCFVHITDREGNALDGGQQQDVTFACTNNGVYAIAVSATNTFNYTARLTSFLPLTITTDSLPDGQVHVTYAPVQLATANGTTPYRWTVEKGSKLPAGLRLNARTGIISGKPRKVGSSTFTVKVRDANKNTAEKSFTLTID